MSIRQLASIDIKSDEQGSTWCCGSLWSTGSICRDYGNIGKIEHDFSSSVFVKSQVGVSGVCEPAAFIAGGRTENLSVEKNQKKE